MVDWVRKRRGGHLLQPARVPQSKNMMFERQMGRNERKCSIDLE